MELFTLDSSLEEKDIQLHLTPELITYWIHFTSFQMHWRGYELVENEHLKELEKHEMAKVYAFFDELYHRFLTYLPKTQDSNQPAIYIRLAIDEVMTIADELDDYIQYCRVYEEKDLAEISKQYKQSFQTLLEDEPKGMYH